MKKTALIKFVLVAFCLLINLQCSTDKQVIHPISEISSASVLAADTSFIEMVKTNREVTKTMLKHLRVLGSNKERDKQGVRIEQLVKEVRQKDVTALNWLTNLVFATKQNSINHYTRLLQKV